MSFDEIVKEIYDITLMKERKTLQELALKTGEEVGELQQAVLSYTGAPGCGYKNKTIDDVLEEAVDTIICAFATAYKDEKVDDETYLIRIFEKKLAKWKEKLG